MTYIHLQGQKFFRKLCDNCDCCCDSCGWSDCNKCGWNCNSYVFFATIVIGVATIVVDCDNCEHRGHIRGGRERCSRCRRYFIAVNCRAIGNISGNILASKGYIPVFLYPAMVLLGQEEKVMLCLDQTLSKGKRIGLLWIRKLLLNKTNFELLVSETESWI